MAADTVVPDSRFWAEITSEDLRRAFLRPVDAHPRCDDGVRPGQPDVRPAAVLVPVVERSALSLLLTRRTDHLHHHPGQISFPGGRVEAADTSPVMTALRETREEIGLQPERIELLGELPDYFTGTGFCVRPVVGLVHPPFDLMLDAFEVAEAFEVPLAFVLDKANRRRHSLTHDGQVRHFHAMPWHDYYIWGATAGMLVALSDFLAERI